MKKILSLFMVTICLVGLLSVNKVKAETDVRGYSQHDVSVISGKSVEEIEYILPRRLKHIARDLYNIEHSSNPVNALFLASIIRFETGNGTSYSYRYKHNLGGIMGRRGTRRFNSDSECLKYMQDMLSRRYIKNGLKSVWAISRRYCQPSGYWARNVNRMSVNSMYKIHFMR